MWHAFPNLHFHIFVASALPTPSHPFSFLHVLQAIGIDSNAKTENDAPPEHPGIDSNAKTENDAPPEHPADELSSKPLNLGCGFVSSSGWGHVLKVAVGYVKKTS